jgi:hypothetical protein
VSDEADVRIGEYRYRVAEGYFDETGLRPMRRRWGSIFAGRQNVSGAPGVQNVKDEDLRWLADSFAGGEGQRVIDPTADDSFRRFEQATTIDFSNPGEMRLARQMERYQSTGGSVTTLEGNTWAQETGPTTVVGSDRRLDGTNASVTVSTGALGAGEWELDFHGYVDPGTVIEGSALVEEEPNTAVNGSDFRLKSLGATGRTVNQDPADGIVTVAMSGALLAPATGKATASIKLIVWNQTNGSKVVEKRLSLTAKNGVDATGQVQVTFTAQAGKTYRYKVVCASLTNASFVTVDKLDVTEGAGTVMLWEMKSGAVVVASGTVNMAGITATQKVAVTSVPSGTYTMRVKRVSGAQNLYVDKGTYQISTLADPRALEIGRSNFTWLVDSSGRVLYWDPVLDKWALVASLAGGTARALAHSDAYEFVAMADKKVYRVKQPATGEAYTAAAIDSIVGITVGGSRLFVLTESDVSGTILYEAGLAGTPPVALTAKYTVGNGGVGADDDVPQRIAPSKNGCVFFVNQGPDCWVYVWDGASGFAFEKLPPGFRGRSITHFGGLTFIGGGFPTVDADGLTSSRPAVFIVDHAATGAIQMDIRLHRDEDVPTQIEAMQLFGPDLYVLCSVSSSPPKMRLWRVSLVEPFAPFLQHEVELDEQDEGGSARGLSVTVEDAFITWSTGGPHRRIIGYNIVDVAEYVSSRYAFGLTEPKRLDEIELVGVIPTGCSVVCSYEIDDSGVVVPFAAFTEPGKLAVSTPEASILGRSIQFRVQLLSPDPSITPIVYLVGLRGALVELERRFELLLLCLDENAVWRLDGSQAPGHEGIEYLYELADSGLLVEVENRYVSADPKHARSTVAAVENPDAFYLRRGEALVRVALVERQA